MRQSPGSVRQHLVILGFALLGSAMAFGTAFADPSATPSYTLTWTADVSAKECPSAAPRLTAAVTERLGFDPFVPAAGRTIEARYARARGGHQVALTFKDETGAVRSTRQLESGSDDCRVLLEAASLAISVAIREEREELAVADAQPEAAVDASPPPVDAAAPRASRQRSTVVPAALPAPLGARVGASLAMVVGPLPRVAFGVDVSGRVALGRSLWGSIGLLHVPEVAARDPRFNVGLDLGRVGLCADPWHLAKLDVESCVHANLGASYTIVQGILARSTESAVLGGGSIGQWLYYRPIPRLAIVVGQEVGVAAPRYRLVVDGSGRDVFTAFPISSFTFLGVALSTVE